jgi:hypothetical protein
LVWLVLSSASSAISISLSLTLLDHNEYGGGNVRKINLISFDDGYAASQSPSRRSDYPGEPPTAHI